MSGFKDRFVAAQERLNRPPLLGQLAAANVAVLCWCNRCAHHARLESRTLALALGPDYPVPEVGARLRCSHCGAKDVAARGDLAASPALGTDPLAAVA